MFVVMEFLDKAKAILRLLETVIPSTAANKKHLRLVLVMFSCLRRLVEKFVVMVAICGF